jgi:hypothetical protein
MFPENFQTLNDCEIFINRKLGMGTSGSEEGSDGPNLATMHALEPATN